MTDKAFNQLTPGEAERLAYLGEELGEAIQAIGKILRHGYESRDPTKQDSKTNREQLEIELRDVMTATTLLVARREVNQYVIMDVDSKLLEIEKWLHYKD
jgi:NTP pyrophosphatase (non-canonical NTP hydrolase)